MDIKRSRVVAVILLLNIILFTCTSAHSVPSSPTSPQIKCPKDTLKFGACGSWLGLVTEVVGTKPSAECCTLVEGIADLEAAACLCTALQANVMGVVKVKVPIAFSLLVNGCGKQIPNGFTC